MKHLKKRWTVYRKRVHSRYAGTGLSALITDGRGRVRPLPSVIPLLSLARQTGTISSIYIRRFALAALFALAASGLFAQGAARPYWYVLETGKRNFSEGSYGDALLDFEDARNIRIAMYTRMEEDFINLLSINEARRYRDDLNMIEKYIQERGQFRAQEALDELYYRVGREKLGGSVQKALEQLRLLKQYPEADYWIGETYRVEGELAISEKQYRKALEHRALLESPGFAVEIEYKLALVLKERGRFTEMEEWYENILKEDRFWQDSRNFVRAAMAKTLKTDGLDRFLVLYRHANVKTEAAQRRMGFYCLSRGRHGKALEHLMFAVLIQNSVIIDEIIHTRFDYTFTGMQDLAAALERRADLKNYMRDVEYYRTLYALSLALYANGATAQARELWAFIAPRAEAGEWAKRAGTNLKSAKADTSFEAM